MGLAQHSDETVEHGTPPWVCDIGRRVVGGEFNLDPASSAYWNAHTFRARRFIDQVEDGLKADWLVVPGMKIGINPPGGGLVKPFFERAVDAWDRGATVFWVGFSLEQFTYLQAVGLFSGCFRRLVTRERIDFLKGASESPQRALFDLGVKADAPVAQGNPTHGTYLLLMPQLQTQVNRFDDEAEIIGSEVF